MAYAEAVTATPPAVTDEMVADLRRQLDDAATGRADDDGRRGERPVAVQQRPRADQPGLQGPLRDPGRAVGRRASHEHRPPTPPLRPAPAAAVQRGLPDAGQRRRRRGRRPGRLAALVGRRPQRRRRRARLPRADHLPAGARPAGLGARPAGELRRAVAARAAADRRAVLRTPGEDAELGEQVSLALLVVLETLSPLERAVFVLREVFGMPAARWPRLSTAPRPPSASWRTGPGSTWRPGRRGSTPTAGPAGGHRAVLRRRRRRRHRRAHGRARPRRRPDERRRWPGQRGPAADPRRREGRPVPRRASPAKGSPFPGLGWWSPRSTARPPWWAGSRNEPFGAVSLVVVDDRIEQVLVVVNLASWPGSPSAPSGWPLWAPPGDLAVRPPPPRRARRARPVRARPSRRRRLRQRGTVATWTAAGTEVTYCIVTDGDAGGFDDTPREQMGPLAGPSSVPPPPPSASTTSASSAIRTDGWS